MTLTLHLYGPLRGLGLGEAVDLDLPGPPTTVRALRRAIGQAVPRLGPALPACGLGVEGALVRDDEALPPGTRAVHLLPPVSGG